MQIEGGWAAGGGATNRYRSPDWCQDDATAGATPVYRRTTPPAKLKLGGVIAWWAVHCSSSATSPSCTRAIARRQVHRRYLKHAGEDAPRFTDDERKKLSPHRETSSAAYRAHGYS